MSLEVKLSKAYRMSLNNEFAEIDTLIFNAPTAKNASKFAPVKQMVMCAINDFSVKSRKNAVEAPEHNAEQKEITPTEITELLYLCDTLDFDLFFKRVKTLFCQTGICHVQKDPALNLQPQDFDKLDACDYDKVVGEYITHFLEILKSKD
jgi:hypothetical protein